MEEQPARKKYSKPIVEEVRLATDEAVLQACKIDNGSASGKTNGRCANPSWMCNIGGS